MTNEVDTHDPAGMARWLRERSEAAQFFTTLTTAAQRLQFLELWQVNVLPHLAFRFKQAAEMVEDLNTKRLQAEHERDVLINQLAQSCDEARADPEFGGCPLEKRAHEPSGVDPNYKLPCEVRLPPSMSIGKGCPLSTLMHALRHREAWSDPQDLVFQDERAMAMRRALSALQSSTGGHLVSNEHEHATYVEPPLNRGAE